MNRLFTVDQKRQVAHSFSNNSDYLKAFSMIFSKVSFLVLLSFFLNTTLNGQCSMACESGLQISIAAPNDCNAIVTPETMLANSASCPGPKNVIITNEFGQTLPQTTLGDGSIASIVSNNNIGQTLLVTVIHPASGNSCWGYVSVEDKIAPTISNCGPVSVFCFQNAAPISEGGEVPVPTTTDCSSVSSTYFDVFEDEECSAPISASINRHWTFTDIYGNASTCIQTIDIDRVSIADYTPICPEAQTLECNSTNQPSILPEVTGYPIIDVDGNLATTDDLFTLDNTLVGNCELGISYSDQIIDLCGDGFKAIRTWSVFDWCAPTQPGVNPWTCIQIIKVEDNTPPVITPIQNITVGTGSNGCTAVLNLPAVQVNDNCTNNINVSTITALGTINGNGGVVPYPGLPLGTNVITYVATDECNNTSTFNLNVIVQDNSPPVVICNLITSVSLQPDGTAIIYAETFDDGSHDNCGVATYEVRRMADSCSPQSPYGPYVNFSCCDIDNGPVTVAMQVTDIHGNTNLCMINVHVQDKTDPILVCPPNKYLDCFENYEDLNLTGEAIATDACGIDTLYYQDYGSIDECGVGTIQRVWSVRDNYDNSASCVQWIYVSNNNPFTINDIVWPSNYTTETCGAGLEPENLPAPFNEPVITEDFCDLVAVTHEDTYLPVTEPACFKILRRWIVVDWCQYEPNNPNSGGYYEYNQIVKVLNSANPEFTSSCTPQSICSYESDCGSTLVTLTASGIDDCTEESQLNFTYEVDVDYDGTIDFSGNGATFQNFIGLGTHWIKWFLEDGCGNVVSCDYIFVVADCKNPTPYCLNGIAIELMPNLGTIDVWASDIDAGSYDNCEVAELRIYSPSMGPGQIAPPVGSSSVYTFDCDDIGEQTVDLWVLDIHGNWAYCITYVDIQDNNQSCTNSNTVSVSGMIENENGQGIENVTVDVSGSNAMSFITGPNGSFNFPSLSMGGNYSLTPEKNINLLNGVSTFDLVLISRHILGINYLNSPYKRIAADVNNSGSVSTFDIVNLRKVILQMEDHFPNNKSWRFIDADFVFPNPANPFATSFPESTNFNGITINELSDFVAVKIGDVNGTANTANLTDDTDSRNNRTMELVVKDQELVAGNSIEVDLYSSDFNAVNGFQFTIEYDETVLSFNEINSDHLENFGQQNYKILEQEPGKIILTWHSAEGLSLDPEEVVLQLKFEVDKMAKLSEVFEINSSNLQAEIYQETGTGAIERFNIVVEVRSEDQNANLMNDAVVVEQNTPNPFKDATSIPFYIDRERSVSLNVFDLSGRLIWTEANTYAEGWNSFHLKRADLKGAGVLYYQIATEGFTETYKMILIE